MEIVKAEVLKNKLVGASAELRGHFCTMLYVVENFDIDLEANNIRKHLLTMTPSIAQDLLQEFESGRSINPTIIELCLPAKPTDGEVFFRIVELFEKDKFPY